MNRRTGITALAAALTACIFPFAGTAKAEIAPRFYREMQHEAPEQLRIKVLTVHTALHEHKPRGPWDDTTYIDVDVTARVEAVTRSASKLRPGQVIRIRYTHIRTRTVGVGPVPVLEVGEICPAYLEKDADGPGYRPAARRASFSPLIPGPKKE